LDTSLASLTLLGLVIAKKCANKTKKIIKSAGVPSIAKYRKYILSDKNIHNHDVLNLSTDKMKNVNNIHRIMYNDKK